MADATDWSAWTNPTGGLLGQNPWQYVGDLGFGLLANSGRSLQPTGGFTGALGRAGQYASERRDQGLLNETRRMALSQAASQNAAEAKFRELLTSGADPTAVKAAASAAYPEVVAKSLFPQALDPDTALRMLEIEQRIKETGAASQTPSATTARSVETLADVFDTAEKEGSPFAPGSSFGTEGVLSKAGLTPGVVQGLPDVMLKPFGDPATLRRQAGQALLIDKETATISQNLTQLADKGTGRSATAINNLNTSLGVGNVPIPVRRKVILGTLETVIDDVESRGAEVPEGWYSLRERLRKQTEGVTKGGEEGAAAYSGGRTPPSEVAAPAESTGGNWFDAFKRSFESAPAVAPAPPAGLPPGVGITPTPPPVQAGTAPPAAPPPAAPAARKVQTQKMLNVPPQAATGSSPAFEGGPLPVFPRKADGERAVAHGWFLTPDGGLWYNP